MAAASPELPLPTVRGCLRAQPRTVGAISLFPVRTRRYCRTVNDRLQPVRETAWWSGMRMRVLSQRFDERWRKLSPLARAVVVDSLVVILALITTLSGDNPEGNQNWAVIAALTLAVRRPLPELALLATVAIDGYSGTDVFPALGLAAFAVAGAARRCPGCSPSCSRWGSSPWPRGIRSTGSANRARSRCSSCCR